jgi:hypothetical protein
MHRDEMAAVWAGSVGAEAINKWQGPTIKSDIAHS